MKLFFCFLVFSVIVVVVVVAFLSYGDNNKGMVFFEERETLEMELRERECVLVGRELWKGRERAWKTRARPCEGDFMVAREKLILLRWYGK